MINYVRGIKELYTLPEQNGQSNVVVQVLFTTTGTDSENPQVAASTVNTLVLSYAGGEFTPFEQLSEAQVLAWVEEAITPRMQDVITKNIQDQIRRKLTAIVKPQVQPLPWS